MIIRKNTLIEGAFISSYVLFLMFSILGHIEAFSLLLKGTTFISILLCIFLCVNNDYSKKEVVLSIFFIAYGLYIYLFFGDASWLKLAIIGIAAKSISFKKIIRCDVFFRTLLFASVVSLYYMGIATDVVSYYNGEYRHSYGFTNPNAAGMFLFIIFLELMYLEDFKLNKLVIISFLLFSIGVWTISQSRTATLMLLFVMVLVIINTYKPSIMKSFLPFCVLCFPICAITTYLLVYMYGMGWDFAADLNIILSHRLYNADVYRKLVDLNFFGGGVGILDRIGLTLDNLYIYMIYVYGTLITFVSLLILVIVMYKLYVKRDTNALYVFFVFSIYGISEKLWFSVDYNVFTLLLIFVFFREHKRLGKYS